MWVSSQLFNERLCLALLNVQTRMGGRPCLFLGKTYILTNSVYSSQIEGNKSILFSTCVKSFSSLVSFIKANFRKPRSRERQQNIKIQSLQLNS